MRVSADHHGGRIRVRQRVQARSRRFGVDILDVRLGGTVEQEELTLPEVDGDVVAERAHPGKVGTVELVATPGDGFPQWTLAAAVVRVDELGSKKIGIVVPQDQEARSLASERRDLAWTGPERRDVAEGRDSVDAVRVDIREDALQRVQVAVDIGENSDSHGTSVGVEHRARCHPGDTRIDFARRAIRVTIDPMGPPITTEHAVAVFDAFHLLAAEPRRALASSARVVIARAGTPIIAESARPESVYGIVQGRLRVSHEHAGGHRSTLSILGPGELCGELAVLASTQRSAEIMAIEDSVVLQVPGEAFIAALESSPRASLALARMLARRLQKLGEHLRQRTALDAEARLAHKLLFLAKRFGVNDRTTIVIDVRLTQQDLAELCDLSRQRVNVLLGRLARAGVVEHRRARMVVRDVAALGRWARDPGSRTEVSDGDARGARGQISKSMG